MAEIKPGSKLTEDQKQKVQQWVQEKARGGMVCSFCGTNTWHLAEDFYEVRIFQGGSIILGGGGAVAPAFMLICDTCGHIELVSAIIAGLIEIPSPSEEQKEEQPSGK
jgi:hypothetical protein